MSMKKDDFPRAGIAEQINDLRLMRGKIEDLKITGYGLISGFPKAPTEIINDLKNAMEVMESASKVAHETIHALYAAPTPDTANDDKVEAA